MRIRRGALLGVCLVAVVPSAWGDLGFEVRASTLGFGGEVNYGFNRFLTAGVGFNQFTYETDFTADDIRYDADLDLQSLSLLAHYHPFGGVFRISAGALLNNNDLTTTGTPSAGTYAIGDQVYNAADVGQLNGDMSFNDFAPYLGLGWGKAFDSRFGLTFDVGVLFQGEPGVDFNATGPIANDPAFVADLQREEQRAQDDLKEFQYYPVVGVGVYFRI